MLWEVDIYPAAGQPNLLARRVAADAADLGFGRELCIDAARGYLIQGQLSREQIDRIAQSLDAQDCANQICASLKYVLDGLR